MPIKAIAFRVLVKPDKVELEREIKTDSGLVVKLQLQADEKMEINAQTIGTIVDIGEDVYSAHKTKSKYAGLKIGDRVYYAKYAGKWCQDPNSKEEFLMLNDDDICGKYVDSSPELATKKA